MRRRICVSWFVPFECGRGNLGRRRFRFGQVEGTQWHRRSADIIRMEVVTNLNLPQPTDFSELVPMRPAFGHCLDGPNLPKEVPWGRGGAENPHETVLYPRCLHQAIATDLGWP